MSGGTRIGFAARFRSYLTTHWPERLRALGVSLVVGMLLGLLVQDLPLLHEANRTAYSAVQKQLGRGARQTDALTMVDLSTHLAPRTSGEIVQGDAGSDRKVLPSKAQEDFRKQIVGLRELLEGISEHRPRAIFVDWQITTPVNLWNAQSGTWSEGVSDEFKDDYEALLATMDRCGTLGCEVFVAGDLVQGIARKGLSTAPGRRRDQFLLSSTLPLTYWRPMYPLAPIGRASGTRLATVSDGLIDFLDLPDLVSEAPKKFGLFTSITRVNQQDCFWIDYGYAPQLISNALYVDLTHFFRPEMQGDLAHRLAGKIVVIADLTEPVGEDGFPIPIAPSSSRVTLGDGTSTEVRGSGGLAQACALLTRTQSPLYNLPQGIPETVFFIFVNIAVAGLAWLISALLAAVVNTPLNTPSEVALELMVLVLVTLAVLMFGLDWMIRARIIVPQIEGYLVTRFLDTVLLAWMLAKSNRATVAGS